MKQSIYILAAVFLAAFAQAQTDSLKKEEPKTQEPQTEIRPFQFTFISPLGTNGVDCYKVTNRVSLNLLVGVSGGLQGFEAGTLANIELGDVKGAQFSGIANVALGDVKGVQYSACFNFCRKDFKGVSGAGLGNISLGTLYGGQFSAGINFNRLGGTGIQMSPLLNTVLGDLKGAQVSACANLAVGNLKGAQVASCLNVLAGDLEGAQVTAFLNVAKKVKGVQIGIVNIADTVDGATIGLFNFVRKGKHQLEFSADETFYANLAFRTGTEALHTIFSAGFRPGSSGTWQLGYGLGSSFRIKDKIWTDINASVHHVNAGGFYWGTSELFRLYWGVDYRISNKFTIAAGPTLNLYVTDTLLKGYQTDMKSVAPYQFINHTTYEDFNVKAWIGFRVAVRIL